MNTLKSVDFVQQVQVRGRTMFAMVVNGEVRSYWKNAERAKWALAQVLWAEGRDRSSDEAMSQAEHFHNVQ